MVRKAIAAGLVVAGVLGAGAVAGIDPLVGTWVAHDVAGDGSTDRYVFSGPDPSGTRAFKLVDSYGSFCETGGKGTGAVLIGSGSATLEGSAVTMRYTSFVCGNGAHGTFDPPLVSHGTLDGDTLTIDGYYDAARSGS